MGKEVILCDWTEESGIICRMKPHLMMIFFDDKKLRIFCYKHYKDYCRTVAEQ